MLMTFFPVCFAKDEEDEGEDQQENGEVNCTTVCSVTYTVMSPSPS